MKLICVKTPCGIDLPLNTKLSIDENEMEVYGLAKQEHKDGLILQWWIVEDVNP